MGFGIRNSGMAFNSPSCSITFQAVSMGNVKAMEGEIDRVYRLLVPHVERSPRSQAGSKRLPILIAFPDYPIQRITSSDLLDVTINDGLHFHGIMLVNIESRLKVRLDMH